MAYLPFKKMQPIDPLDQLALCCGFRNRRRKEYGYPPESYYGPPAVRSPGGWAYIDPYSAQTQGIPPQPYILLSQPVIIAANPTTSQTNMTLLQHAQTGQDLDAIRNLRVLSTVPQQQAIQPSLISSQYAVYSSTAALGAPTSTIDGNIANSIQSGRFIREPLQDRARENFGQTGGTPLLSRPGDYSLAPHSNHKTQQRTRALNPETFRQLELIEKQFDLSSDIEFIERQGTVITRAIDPNSLRPHLTDAKLRGYQSLITVNDDYLIKFIEIIKRPGQTLGLYIRSVQIDQGRDGLVITKIESDSPIYNSHVLHIGDEILSVNLIDVQGLSIDDIVIIMSIPRRLVLALRVPADREPPMSMSESLPFQRYSYQHHHLHRQNNYQTIHSQHQGGIQPDFTSPSISW